MQLLQVMPSSGKGGAEVLFDRTVNAFSSRGIKQHLILRKNATYDFRHLSNVERSSLPFLNKYDVYTKYALIKKTSQLKPAIVLSWLRRGNQMTQSAKQNNSIYVGRLDGYYKMCDFLHNDYLIAHTPSIKQHIINAGYPENKVKIIPNFLKEPANRSRLYHLKPKDKTLVVCWGRFIKKKGFETVIRSLANHKKVHLWLVGDGEEKQNLEQLALKLGVREQITLFGWQQDISLFLFTADILVVPSLHEPFGNVVIEAWAHKKPLLCSNSEGPSWLVKHKHNGLIFKKGSVDSLSKQFSHLIESKSLCKELAANGHISFLDNYSVDAVIPQYIHWFRELCNP